MKLYPDMYRKNILDICYDKLKKNNINTLVFDFDNTIIESKNYQVKKEFMSLFKNLKKSFNVVILSNTINKKHIEVVCKMLDIDYIYFGCKPFSLGFKKILKMYNIKNKEMAIIGDQLFTDIKGAKRFGCYSILVDPINNDEHIFTKINRLRELRLQKKMKDFERGKYYG